MNRFNTTVEKWMSHFDKNEYLSTALSLFLILYAGLAAPKLPVYFARLFDYPLFKLLVFFLIAYTANKNPTVAIIAAVGLMVSLNTLNRYKIGQRLMNMMESGMGMEMEMKSMEGMSENMGEGASEDMVMEEEVGPEEDIPEEVLTALQEEATSPVPEAAQPEVVPNGSCAKRASYRNSFYPQYLNMKPDAYMSRYTGNSLLGFDKSATYASI